MIDIHSHIIFAVDDGPKTIEESLDLIGYAFEQGVRHIVATSHRRKGMFETPEEVIKAHFDQLKLQAAQAYPELTLSYGGELYFNGMIDKLEKGLVPTMNGTRFILLEFSMTTPWSDIKQTVSKVMMLGLTPILAHIERYDALAFEADRVKELIDLGSYTQINSAHILKSKLFGDANKHFKKRAKFFLDQDLVHCVASDMHNLDKRPPFMKEARDLVVKTYGQARAQALFETNAQTLLDNQYL